MKTIATFHLTADYIDKIVRSAVEPLAHIGTHGAGPVYAPGLMLADHTPEPVRQCLFQWVPSEDGIAPAVVVRVVELPPPDHAAMRALENKELAKTQGQAAAEMLRQIKKQGGL